MQNSVHLNSSVLNIYLNIDFRLLECSLFYFTSIYYSGNNWNRKQCRFVMCVFWGFVLRNTSEYWIMELYEFLTGWVWFLTWCEPSCWILLEEEIWKCKGTSWNKFCSIQGYAPNISSTSYFNLFLACVDQSQCRDKTWKMVNLIWHKIGIMT